MNRFFIIILCLFACRIAVGQEQIPYTWTADSNSISGRDTVTPGENGTPLWHLLRTTTSEGPVASRTWAHDGKYTSLDHVKENLFGQPISGAIFQISPTDKAPFIGAVTERHTGDVAWEKGELMVTPGPDHAAVLGWQSPADLSISINGLVDNRQICCGANSQVNWYLEIGPAPTLEESSSSISLAKGFSDAQNGGPAKFDIQDIEIQEGMFIYLIIDCKPDGSGSPHHGDGTTIQLNITTESYTPPPPPTFEKDILPILSSRCLDCHGTNTQEADLAVHQVSKIIFGGENGSALEPGNPESSYLWTMIQQGAMPPEESEPLTSREKAIIFRWIKTGASTSEDLTNVKRRTYITDEDREFWAYRLPKTRSLPAISNIQLAESPIDNFLLKRLEDESLSYSEIASKNTLIRRLYFDLIGLPPSPEQIEDFLNDDSANAYSQLVDRLLASPRYGERWGRHWMDTVGYVDVRLYDGDGTTVYVNEGMWRYRDYIIRSFNTGKPYDQFIQEQLAGDELVDWKNTSDWSPEVMDKVVATGYLRNIEDHTSEPQYGIDRRYEVMYDLMSMVSTSLLGMTFECSRCHNHKFDPITQRDYYSLLSYFESSYNPRNWLRPQERWIPDVGPIKVEEYNAHNAALDAQIGPLNEQIEALTKENTENENNSNDEKIAELRTQVHHLTSQRKSHGKIQALFDVGDAPITNVFRRGDCFKRGIPVKHDVPEVFHSYRSEKPDDSIPQNTLPEYTSGRRLELARWITSRQNPMTSRVVMNRLWLHHFGEAIVSTPENLGRSGARPTHPELLDWLAIEFQDSGWDLKHMHRLVLNSRAYKQSSKRPETANKAESVDPDNALLWRQNLKRLESEIIRDAILTVSDQVNLQAYGPPAGITKPVSGLSMVEAGTSGRDHQRRSVYVFARRVYPLKFMEIFDSPIMAINCSRRSNSTTVLQSFAQLNSDFVINAAKASATQLITAYPQQNTPAIIKDAFTSILGRKPTAEESALCIQHITEQFTAFEPSVPGKGYHLAVADLCHMLLCMNEFLYVD